METSSSASLVLRWSHWRNHCHVVIFRMRPKVASLVGDFPVDFGKWNWCWKPCSYMWYAVLLAGKHSCVLLNSFVYWRFRMSRPRIRGVDARSTWLSLALCWRSMCSGLGLEGLWESSMWFSSALSSLELWVEDLGCCLLCNCRRRSGVSRVLSRTSIGIIHRSFHLLVRENFG